ncbi:MAG: FtsX-like permease family protein [Firmicutes bacterium]|nr:FtsX-like permease family protein [Bacillota bacterium]
MSRAYFKSILRSVRESLARFLAIFAIVALGVGFLAGLWSTTPDMHLSLDSYYDQQQMADVFIKATHGLTEDDIAALAGLPSVAHLLPAKVVDTLVATTDNGRLTARLYGLPWAQLSGDQPLPVNRWQLVAGRLPQTPQECLVEQGDSYLESLELGSTLSIVTEADNADLFATTQFTVVGVVANPFYFANEREPSNVGKGRLEAVIYIADSCYDLDLYTDAYLTNSQAAELMTFSAAYEEQLEDFVAELEQLGEERSRLRYAQIHGEGQAELDQARADLAAAEQEAAQELASAWQDILDARQELAEAREELDRGRADLAAARTALAQEKAQAEAQLAQTEQELMQARQELEQGEQSLAAALEAGLIGPEQAAVWRQELDQGWEQYRTGVAALEGAKTALAQEMAAAEARLAQAARQLEQGERDYDEGRRQLASGEADYWQARAEVEQELEQARLDLEDAARQLDELEMPSWYVLDRNANVSYASFTMNTEKVQAIATVFPVFFMLVAALVSLASMTRMIEEERTQIGIMKALGYGRWAIMEKYMGYCGLASLAGSIVGLLVGFRYIPVVIWQVFATMYPLPTLYTPFRWPFALVATLGAVLLTLLVTIYASNRALQEKPAMLMRPRPPKAGKRILLEKIKPLWSRLSFSHKATARNLFRYKKHFYMTVLGVAGCTALLVTGFGLQDSIGSLGHTQFSELMHYDLSIDCSENRLLDPELETWLNHQKSVLGFTAFYGERGTAHRGESDAPVTVFVPHTPADWPQFITLRERPSGDSLDLATYPVVISETLARALGLKAGDQFSLEDSEGVVGELTVAAITENYVGSYVYIHPSAYQAAYGQEAKVNRVLANTRSLDAAEQDQLMSQLLEQPAVVQAEFLTQAQHSFDRLVESIDFLVVVIILAAGALAMIVLYNLININIAERHQELATLRVLGFHHHEVAGYIYRETAILSLIGTLVGLPLGKLLHAFVIRQAESNDLMLGQSIAPLSYLWAALLTLHFSGLVCLVMVRKLKQIKMVDSLKAVE